MSSSRLHTPHLVLVITEDWYFWSHRRALARGALEDGFQVTLVSRFAALRERIEAESIRTVDLPFGRLGRNPFAEGVAVGRMVALYRRLRPSVVHHVAIKPVLYGSLAARIVGVPGVVNAIAGLGYAFTGSTPIARVIRGVATTGYRAALRGSNVVTIFQNDEDRSHFVRARMVPPEQTALIRGSGVDLVRFRPVARERDVPVLLYAGRMLWSKGIGEIVEAARLLRRANVPFRLELAGDPDEANPESIPEDTLRRWEEEGIVRWRGQKDDMAAVLSSADVVVLASRREGVPKILLEAAGAGLPIVATDVPGCREVVEHERNGLLVPLDNREALAEALGRLLTDVALRRRMGDASRRKAEAEFDERRVVTETLALYRRFIPPVGEHA